MKNALRKIVWLLLAIGVGCFAGFRYLEYEQRIELVRFQSGLAEGIRYGALQERRKLIGKMDCFGMVKGEDGTQAMLCSVPIAQRDLDNDAVTLGSDLEQ